MTTENKNQEAVVEETKTEVVETNTKAPATVGVGSNYVTMILEENRKGFLEANAGLDLDYVRMGEWLKINKKGNFIEKDNEEVSYGDKMDVVVGYGEQRYTLWGKDNTPEKGQIICMEQTEEAAQEALGQYLMEHPEAAERYSQEDIDLRYLAYVVPVEAIAEAAKTDDLPPIYLMSFPKGDTIGWGRYAMNVYNGKFKALGIPRRTAGNRVVTRLVTEERENNNKESYLGIKFEAVGLFNPADYGIKQ
jgi:hypothetical protein